MNAYQWVTDDVLQQISRLEHGLKDSDRRSDVKAAQYIIDRIYCRDLYKLIVEKRVKWDKESIKAMNAAEKLKTVLDSLKQSTMEIHFLKDDIEMLKTYQFPEAKSVKQKIAEKLTTLVSSLKQSSNEIVSLSLPGNKAEILETYPFPDIKSAIENIDPVKLTPLADSLQHSARETASLKDFIAEIIKTHPVPETESIQKDLAAKQATLQESLEESKMKIDGLIKDIEKILKTSPIPKAKSVIEAIEDDLEKVLKVFIQREIKAGIIQDNIAKELTTDQVPKKLYEIEEAVFSYGRGRQNPMEKVKFHQIKAQRNPNDYSTDQYENVNSEVMDKKKSDMLPTSFEEIYIRLYWKGVWKDVGEDEKEIDKKRKDILEEAFLEIKEFECKMKRTFKGELVNI